MAVEVNEGGIFSQSRLHATVCSPFSWAFKIEDWDFDQLFIFHIDWNFQASSICKQIKATSSDYTLNLFQTKWNKIAHKPTIFIEEPRRSCFRTIFQNWYIIRIYSRTIYLSYTKISTRMSAKFAAMSVNIWDLDYHETKEWKEAEEKKRRTTFHDSGLGNQRLVCSSHPHSNSRPRN